MQQATYKVTGVHLPLQELPANTVHGCTDDLLPSLESIGSQLTDIPLSPLKGSAQGWLIRTLEDPKCPGSRQPLYKPAEIRASALAHQQWHEAGILDHMPLQCRVLAEISRINSFFQASFDHSGLRESMARIAQMNGVSGPIKGPNAALAQAHLRNRMRHAENQRASAYRRLGASVYGELESLAAEGSIKTVIGSVQLLHMQIMALTQQCEGLLLGERDQWVGDNLLNGLRTTIFNAGFLFPSNEYHPFLEIQLEHSPMQESAIHYKTNHLLQMLSSEIDSVVGAHQPVSERVH